MARFLEHSSKQLVLLHRLMGGISSRPFTACYKYVIDEILLQHSEMPEQKSPYNVLALLTSFEYI